MNEQDIIQLQQQAEKYIKTFQHENNMTQQERASGWQLIEEIISEWSKSIEPICSKISELSKTINNLKVSNEILELNKRIKLDERLDKVRIELVNLLKKSNIK